MYRGGGINHIFISIDRALIRNHILGSKIQSKYTHGLQDKKRSKSRLFGWFSNTLKPLTLSLWAFFQPSFRLFESVRKILPKAFESKSTICILYQLCRCVFKKRDFLPFCKFPWDRRKGIFFAFNLEFDLLEFFFYLNRECVCYVMPTAAAIILNRRKFPLLGKDREELSCWGYLHDAVVKALLHSLTRSS